MMNALIPKYAYSLGANAAVVGVVSSMFAVTALIIRPVAGPAMDYYSKSRLLTASVSMLAVAFVVYGLSKDVTVMIIARLLHGLGIGVAVPLSLAMATNALPERKMVSGIGMYSLGAAVATAVGPWLGLKLMELLGYNNTFFILAAWLVLCVLLTLRLKSYTPVRHSPFRIKLERVFVTDVIIPTIIIFFITFAFSSINSFIVIYAGLMNIDQIGLYFTAYAISLLISRPISGAVADKYGTDKTIIPGLLIFAASFIIISYARTLPMFIFAGVLCAFGYGVCVPTLQALCMLLVPKQRRGAAGNTNYMVSDSVYFMGPAAAGLIITVIQSTTGSELSGYQGMYRMMVIPVIVALLFFILTSKIVQEKLAQQQAAGDSENAERERTKNGKR
ncbi:MAG: MFS transporter [Clostridiales bacterium]|nr:MFS transporter [Clostridiales bacterium]